MRGRKARPAPPPPPAWAEGVRATAGTPRREAVAGCRAGSGERRGDRGSAVPNLGPRSGAPGGRRRTAPKGVNAVSGDTNAGGNRGRRRPHGKRPVDDSLV